MNGMLFAFETPSMPKLDPARCSARTIGHKTASALVEQYHYAHRVPSITVAVGMYVDDVLAGVVTYGLPASPESRQICGKEHQDKAIELNRLFVHDWAGANSESWLIARSFEVLRRDYPQYKILVSYADTGKDHTGYVYQATNWLYTGYTDMERTRPRFDYVVPSSALHSREISRLGGAEEARQLGGVRVERSAKHRYVYFLGSKVERKQLLACLRWSILPYPKAGQP